MYQRKSALMLTLLIKMCIAFLKKVGNIIKLSSLKYELKHEMLPMWNRVNVYRDIFLISEWCMSTYVNKKGMSLDRLSKFDIIVFSLDIMCRNTYFNTQRIVLFHMCVRKGGSRCVVCCCFCSQWINKINYIFFLGFLSVTLYFIALELSFTDLFLF